MQGLGLGSMFRVQVQGRVQGFGLEFRFRV